MEISNAANRSKVEHYFLLALLSGVLILTFFILKPFLYTVILAIVFATIFWPVHKKALVITRGGKSLAALLTTVCILLLVVVPLTFLSVQILQEATQLYSSLVTNDGVSSFSHNVSDTLQGLANLSPVPIEVPTDVNQYLKQGLSWLLQHLGPLFASFAKVLVSIFIFLVALYYLFKDGDKLKRTIITLSPLQDKYDETIFSKLALAVNSVTKGSLAVALIQGILTAIGLTLFGIPNVVLWGSIAAVAALVPTVGTSLVLFPAILYLYFGGDVLSAVGLLLWGSTAVGLVDNFLGPKLVGRGIQLHSFLVLLSVLGGIAFFGPIGFLLGPLVLSMFFVLLEIISATTKNTKAAD